MSVKLMGDVWECKFTKAEQSVMLAMADHAQDDGTQCFPSVDRIAWKTDYSGRQVQRVIHSLCERGILIVIAKAGRNRGVEYRIDLNKAEPKPPYVPKRGDTMSSYRPKGDMVSSKKGDMVSQSPRKGDTVSPQNGGIVTPRGDIFDVKGDILSLKGDIAMSPESLTINQLRGNGISSPDHWFEILDELAKTYPANFPATKWLAGSRLVEAADVAGIPLYQVQVCDPESVGWLTNRMGGQLRRSLSMAMGRRVLIEIVAAEPAQEDRP